MRKNKGEKTMTKYFIVGLPDKAIKEMLKRLKHLQLPKDTKAEIIFDDFLEFIPFFHVVAREEKITVKEVDPEVVASLLKEG